MSTQGIEAPEVFVLRWPAESEELARLADSHRPRLLLVADGAEPPTTDDCLQDWVQMPARDRELEARLAGLRARAASHSPPPTIDHHGRRFYRGDWVALSPVERRLLAVLLAHFGRVVVEHDLLDHVWPGQPPTSNAFRVHLTRMRRRIRPLGLEIRTVRSQGFVLQDLHHTGPYFDP
jgi:hypothetical protein